MSRSDVLRGLRTAMLLWLPWLPGITPNLQAGQDSAVSSEIPQRSKANHQSDLLIVLDSNGRDYLAQHTLVSDGDLLVAFLPEGHVALHTRFTGPEWLMFSSAYQRNPEQLALWSGSVLSRYRHRYGTGLSEPEPGIFELDVASEHPAVLSDDPERLPRSISWILPANVRLLDFENRVPTASGGWRSSGAMISWQQRGGPAPDLQLRFALQPVFMASASGEPLDCTRQELVSEACSPDVDGDEVPDHRDVCLPAQSEILALTEPEAFALPVARTVRTTGAVDTVELERKARIALGCQGREPIRLSGIRFSTGRSYLNAASRLVLDRVARALEHVPDVMFEIAVHTDNAGRVEHNQSLSSLRARRIREYLMLLGVPGERLLARGHGETSPAYDNALAAGRRANRRVELLPISNR